MALPKIGGLIVLDGQQEFKNAVANCNTSLRNMKSELELVKAKFAGQENSLEALTEKHKVLNNILTAANEKQKAAKNGLKNAEEAQKKVENGLKTLNKQYEEEKKKLDEIKKKYGASSDEAKSKEKVVKNLAETIERGNRNYEKAGNRITNWKTQVNRADAEIIKANRDLVENTRYMNEASNSADKCAHSIDEYGNKTRESASVLGKQGEALNALSTVMASAGIAAGLKEIEGAMLDCVSASNEYGAGIAKVMTIADSSKVSMTEMKDSISQVSNDFARAPSEMAEATYQAISASVKTADAVGFVEDASKAAIAGFTDTATSVDVLTTILNAYKKSASETTKVSDVLLTTQNLGKTTFGQLAGSMGKVIPLAAAFGVNLENVSSAYAIMTKNGIKTDEAGTYIRATLQDLGKEGSKVANILKESTGKSFAELMNEGMSLGDVLQIIYDSVNGDTTAFQNLWGNVRSGIGALSIMTSGAEGFNEILGNMENSAGSTEEAFQTMTNTADFADKKFTNSMENLKIAIGDQLSPALANLKSTGSDVFEWATDFVKENPGVVRALAAVTTGLTVFTAGLTGVAVAVNVIKPLLAGLSGTLMGPVGIALAAGSALAALATFAISTSGTYQTEGQKVEATTSRLKNEINDLKKSISETSKAQDDSVRSTASQYQAYDSMVTRLYELSRSGDKSAKTMQEMSLLTNQLNSAIPSLNLSIDQQTGALNQNEQAVRRVIQALKDKAMQEVLGEQLVELYKQQAEAFDKQTEAAKQQGDIANSIQKTKDHIDSLVKAQEEYILSGRDVEQIATKYGVTAQEVLGEQAAIEQLNIELGTYQTAQNTAIASEEEAAGAFRDASDAIDKKNESAINNCYALNMSADEQKKYTDALRDGKSYEEAYAEATGQTEISMLAMAAAAEASGESVDTSSGAIEKAEDALKALREQYEQTVSEIKASIEEKIDLFSAFDGGESTSVDTMLSNLDSQLEGLRNWKENMKTIAGEVGNAIGPELYDKLLALGPEGANTIQEVSDAIANGGEAGQEKLKELSRKYAEAFDFSDEASKNLGATSMVISTMIEKMNDDATKADFSALSEAVSSASQSAIGEWERLPEETRDRLQGTIEAARDIGAEIPGGLADGIASGSVSPADAVSQLQNGINTQLTFLSEMAEQAGIKIPQDIKDGILAGGQSAVQAVSSLVELLSGEQAKTEKASANSGKKASESMGVGMKEAAGQVSSSASSVAAGGATAAAGQVSSYRKLGYDFSAGMAAGVQSGSPLVSGAVTNMVNQGIVAGKKAQKSNSPSKRAASELGEPIPQGAAIGVDRESQRFADATSGMVEAGLNQASKKAKKKVGDLSKEIKRSISRGFSVSKTIEKNGTTEAKTASEYGAEVVSAASKYMDNYKIFHNVSDKLEQKYWEQVSKRVKKGTQAWYDAQKKIKDIKKEIAQSKADNKEFTTSGKALGEYKTYYKVSEKAEMQYWDKVRKKFKEGTEYRIEADKKYFEAKENYYSKMKDLEDDYFEKCNNIKEKLEKDIEDQKKTYEDAFNDRKNAIKSAFGLFDEFKSEAAAPEKLLTNMQAQVAGYALWMEQMQQLSSRGLLNNAFMKELSNLGPESAATIVSLNMMTDEQLRLANEAYEKKSQLAESQALEETEEIRRQTENKIRELQSAAQKELNAYKAEYDKAANELSSSIEKPLADLANKAKKIGDDTINNYIKSVKSKATSAETKTELKQAAQQFTDVLQSLPKAGKKIGRQTIEGILAGFQESLSITSASEELVSKIEKSMKKSAKIKSPSKRFRDEIGKQIPAGVSVGMEQGAIESEKVSADIIDKMLDASEERLNKRLEEARSLMSSVNSYGNIQAMSQLAVRAGVPNNTINVDNSSVAKSINGFAASFEELKEEIRNMKIVLDTGTLVGEIANDVGSVLIK